VVTAVGKDLTRHLEQLPTLDTTESEVARSPDAAPQYHRGISPFFEVGHSDSPNAVESSTTARASASTGTDTRALVNPSPGVALDRFSTPVRFNVITQILFAERTSITSNSFTVLDLLIAGSRPGSRCTGVQAQPEHEAEHFE
jgi:hypothetical protein